MRKQVLLVEDERGISEPLAAYFEREGMTASVCSSVAAAIASLNEQRPDILILDVMLPDGNGFDVLRAASANGRIPTIVLTSRGDEIDRVLGLELGADDYVPKPFSPRELVARTRAVLRRSDGASLPETPAERPLIVGDLAIDSKAHEVRRRGEVLNVTPSEYRILLLLAQHPGQVFTRAQLLDALGDDGTIYERTLDRHINNLRRKIEPSPEDPQYVLTVFGVGYKMRKP